MADIQFNLRIPAELKDRIAEAAKENNRSINAEAQSRLEKSFDKTNIDFSDLITRQEETIQYMRILHEQNQLLSQQLETEQKRNEKRFSKLNVLVGLEPVPNRSGTYIDDKLAEIKSDPSQNYLELNKKKGK